MKADKLKINYTLEGISVSNGIGIGRINVYHTDLDDVPEYTLETCAIIDELERYYAVINEVNLLFLHKQRRIARDFGTKHAEIYEAYHVILEDPFFQEEIPEIIRKEHKNAEAVISHKLALYEKMFDNIKDEYLRERVFDVRGVSRRVIYHLLQMESTIDFSDSTANLIFAKELTPADSIHFHHRMLKGIVTEFGGKTSHAAILARSIEVPAIVGVPNLLKQIQSGDTAIVDGNEGKLIICPDEDTINKYRIKKKKYFKRKEKLIQVISQPITQLGDRKIQLLANINDPSEIELAHKYNCDGVGLFRTELNFIAKETFLDEDEQYSLYRNVLMAFPGKEVVIRVLDLGGDKFLPFAQLHRELNPFLGWRSIRILLSEVNVFKTQLRAILRAAIYGNAKILIPMISSMEEIVAAKEIYQSVKNELRKENISFKDDIPFGIMIEIPSAAITIDSLIQEVDFVSIGTNDLVQYTLAVDRNNEKVADFYQPLNPAVLQLIKNVAEAGKKYNKPVSVCGETAGEPLYTQLLLSLQIDQLSMHPAALPVIKNLILNTNSDLLDEIAQRTFTFNDIESLQQYLKKHLKKII